MKNKHLVMLLLSSCCLAACVDSKYDLSDVNTDDAVMGESWVAPLGTGYVTSDDVVNVEKVPSIREVDGAYVMIYDGEMKIKGKSLRAASGKVEIASEDITTGDIDGLFDGDFVLALTNPHITLKSNVKNASLDCSLSIEAENTSKKEATPLILPCQRCLLIFGSALLIRRRMLLSLSRTRSYRESYRLFLKKYICLCPLIANNGRTLLRMP